MIFYLLLVSLWAALILIGLLSANKQTLIDRCGVEVIAPEDLTDKPQILTQLLASGALRKL